MLVITLILSLYCCSIKANPNLTSPSKLFPPVQNEPLMKFIKKQINLHIKPVTFWLLDGEDKNIHTDQFPLENIQNHFTTIPVVRGDFSKFIRKKHHHFTSFIFLITVPSKTGEVRNLVEKVKLIGNRRKDRFIFIGKNRILTKIFKNEIIIGLKNKFGFAWETQEILIDPDIFTEGTMLAITDPDEWNPLPQMCQNMRGRHIRISGCLLPPWLFRISDDKNAPPEKQYDGNNFRMFFESSKKFNYTFEIHAPPDQVYGDLLPNGTWIGEVGDIHYTERKYDLAILLGHVEIWYPLVDFAGSLDFAKLMFFTSHPQLEIRWKAFFNPYEIPVWITVIVFYAVMSVAMLIVLLVQSKISPNIPAFTTFEMICMAFGIPFGIAMEQNVRIPNKIRYLSALWMVSVIITGIGYKCNLASYLSFPSITPAPSSYSELAARKDYKIILNVLGVAEKAFFETNESPTMKSIKKRLDFMPDPMECATAAFINPKTACIAWTPLITAFMGSALTLNTRIEPLVISKEPALPVSMSVGFQKDSIFVDSFTPVTHVIFESGLYVKWELEAYYYHKVVGRQKMMNQIGSLVYTKIKENEEALMMGGFTPFSLKNLQFSFLILITGLFLSCLVILYEIFCCRPKTFKIPFKSNLKLKVDSKLKPSIRIFVKSQRKR